MTNERAKQWGRIGGLTAWSRHGSDRLVSKAREGFAARFDDAVDPDRSLPPAERARRADRARRAYMLTLAEKSAKVRRQRKATSAGSSAEVAKEIVDATDEHQRRE